MSLIRFSAIKNTLYAPHPGGDLEPEDYRAAIGRGNLGAVDVGDLYGGNSPIRSYLNRQLRTRADALPADAPVTVLIHGFLFDVEKVIRQLPHQNDNPHGRLYHFNAGRSLAEEIREHTTSWPLRLGFADDAGQTGLAVAFGWYSSPGLARSLFEGFKSHYSRAYEYAEQTAWVLVALLRALADHPTLAGRRIDLFCHSLGSRVVVRALAMMADTEPARPAVRDLVQRIGQVILLGGSEYVVEAQLMVNRLNLMNLPDDGRPKFFNVVSRENDVLDTLGENLGPRTFGDSRVIGHKGLAVTGRDASWIDLAIDSGPLRDWLFTERQHDISGDQPGNVWDHWYYYTYPGNMAFYRDLLRNRGNWAIPALRAAGIPDGTP